MTDYLVRKAEFPVVQAEILAQTQAASGDNIIRGIPNELTAVGAIVAAGAGLFTLFKTSWEKREKMQADNYQMLLNRLVENVEEDRKSILESVKAQSESTVAMQNLAESVGKLVETQVNTEELLKEAVETQAKSDASIADLVVEIKEAVGQGKGVQNNVLELVNGISGRLDKWEKILELWFKSNLGEVGFSQTNGNNKDKSNTGSLMKLISMIANK